MVGNGLAQWTLTAVFAMAAGYHLLRLGRQRDRWSLLDDGLHVVMSVGMVAMLWPWGVAVPVMAYVLVFTAAALWFAARALFFVSPAVVGAEEEAAPVLRHHGSRGTAWYHAGMMASMIFMAVAMGAGMSALPPAVDTAAGAGTAMAGMAGMDGMSGTGGTGAAPGDAAMAMPAGAWVQVPSLVLAAAFGVATLWWLLAGLRARDRRSVPVAAAGALMAAGMAAAFLQMA